MPTTGERCSHGGLDTYLEDGSDNSLMDGFSEVSGGNECSSQESCVSSQDAHHSYEKPSSYTSSKPPVTDATWGIAAQDVDGIRGGYQHRLSVSLAGGCQ